MNTTPPPYLSLIIPVYNEEKNIIPLFDAVFDTFKKQSFSYEIICIDDGSIDDSFVFLIDIANDNNQVKIIRFKKNFGQTAAMDAGISYSKGEIIVFLDADMQNDPSDIPTLLRKIEEGYDIASGWRTNRRDKLFLRKIPSKLANSLIRRLSGVKIHDLGCSLKAYKRDMIKDIHLYGEMHRFLPVIAARKGAKIVELPVKHHARKHGKSHYNLNRTFKVLLDLITVQFISAYSTKPIYLYGGFALLSLFLGLLSGLAVILMKIFYNTDMTGNPFLLLTVLFMLITIILALMGVQTEVLIRIYHQQGKTNHYFVNETINITKEEKWASEKKHQE
ncbi:MAG: glycosyltransferase family 2 protein [Candidatus Delongbacteria bacterium]|jgi:glycosyltransferase involved in cell wall biosynthesis|nr:glycosyltransferase family 2 protein [Candidatus Delongbacteria bacterium]